MNDALENERLTSRAYKVDLAEQKNLIESQLFAALAQAQYLSAVHQYNLAVADLYRVMGRTY